MKERIREARRLLREQGEEGTIGSVHSALREIKGNVERLLDKAPSVIDEAENLSRAIEKQHFDAEGSPRTYLPSIRSELVNSKSDMISNAVSVYPFYKQARGKKKQFPTTTGVWQLLGSVGKIDISPSGSGFPGKSPEPGIDYGFANSLPNKSIDDIINTIITIPDRVNERFGIFMDAGESVFGIVNDIMDLIDGGDPNAPIPDDVPGMVAQRLVPTWRRFVAWQGAAIWANEVSAEGSVSELLRRLDLGIGESVHRVDEQNSALMKRPWVKDPSIRPWLPL